MSADYEFDLTNCDREPIHRLGKIQPFGALVALNADWMVARYSRNFAEILGADTDIGPGVSLLQIFSPEAIEKLRVALRNVDGPDAVERIFGVDLLANDALFDVAVHSSGRLTIVEFEPHDTEGFGNHIGSLRPMMSEMDKFTEIEPLCQYAAERMKHLLGFDRVMVYKFRADGSGEVIGESREPHLESYLTLRYPATDIPKQARALYVRNLFRIITDVNGEQVPIEPEVSIEGDTIDLSLSTLRAVSPIHLEYLRNIGVQASLSISIVIDGKLWGLFACHHYEPRMLPYSLRTVAELFSQLFSLMLGRRLSNVGNRLGGRGRALHDRLMARLAGGTSLVENIETIDSVIGEVIPHAGTSAYVEGVYKTRGKAPSEEEFRALVPALNSASTSRIFATDSIGEQIPAAQAFADRVVGAMVIPVSRRPRDYLVLWRRELPQVVTWAGNPEKAVETGPHGDRLTPRKSFEAWQQSVSGHSEAWSEEELQIAESLRVTLLEVILRLTDEAMQDRARAQQQQELLIAELNHRVRNILNLIRSLISQTRHEASDIASFSEIVGGRIASLASAHDNITKQNWSPASLKELIRNEAEAYSGGKGDRVKIEGPDVLIAPEAYTVLALVIHEMMTNSAKYGSLCDSSGTITVKLSRNRDEDLCIDWRERGGPPVKPPERRGFGSTIIERSIPFELKGEADVRYKLSGVEADFVVPGRFVTPAAEEGNMSTGESASPQPKKPRAEGSEFPRHVLVVEDSMIIAMDAEDSLRQIGVEVVTTAGSVRSALESIAQDPPQLAILDYNLGTETSDPIADKLRDLGVPFYLATGYGELGEKLEEQGARGLLKKPYGKDELEGMLEEFTAG